MELQNGTENRIRELDKNVWGYCIMQTKYILVDFSKISENLEKTYKNQALFGFEFGRPFSRWINDNDDGDEILIVTKGIIRNTVLGKFVLIRKRNHSDTKMIIDKIDNESGLKNFCENRISNSKQMKRGLITHQDFYYFIDKLTPQFGEITKYLIYVKQKPPYSPTEGLDNLFKHIKIRLLEFYKDELVVDKMIKSYVGDTIDYIEPSVPLVFPDLKEGQTFSSRGHITEIIQHDGYKEYMVKGDLHPKCLYDYLDGNGQILIDLNNNATPGRKMFKDMFKSMFTKKYNEKDLDSLKYANGLYDLERQKYEKDCSHDMQYVLDIVNENINTVNNFDVPEKILKSVNEQISRYNIINAEVKKISQKCRNLMKQKTIKDGNYIIVKTEQLIKDKDLYYIYDSDNDSLNLLGQYKGTEIEHNLNDQPSQQLKFENNGKTDKISKNNEIFIKNPVNPEDILLEEKEEKEKEETHGGKPRRTRRRKNKKRRSSKQQKSKK